MKKITPLYDVHDNTDVLSRNKRDNDITLMTL